MPKRIVDGDALWRSDKLAKLEPWMRSEPANLIPLALANGSFECNDRLIWSRVYAYNRPDVTLEQVGELLSALERVGILIRWNQGNKTWGYWVGIDKPGRLPSPTRQSKKHEAVGPVPPPEILAKAKANQWSAIEQPLANEQLTNGEVGSGSGLGTGIGSGKGKGFGSGCEVSSQNSSAVEEQPNATANPQNPPIRENQNLDPKCSCCFGRVTNVWQGYNGQIFCSERCKKLGPPAKATVRKSPTRKSQRWNPVAETRKALLS